MTSRRILRVYTYGIPGNSPLFSSTPIRDGIRIDNPILIVHYIDFGKNIPCHFFREFLYIII